MEKDTLLKKRHLQMSFLFAIIILILLFTVFGSLEAYENRKANEGNKYGDLNIALMYSEDAVLDRDEVETVIKEIVQKDFERACHLEWVVAKEQHEVSNSGYIVDYDNQEYSIYAHNRKGYIRGLYALWSQIKNHGEGEFSRVFFSGKNKPTEIYVGEKNISEYSIVLAEDSANVREAAGRLKAYIAALSGEYIDTDTEYKAGGSIVISDEMPPYIDISQNDIYLHGTASVEIFANRFLGYAFAGEDRQHILNKQCAVRIPGDIISYDEQWMSDREAIVCLWKTDRARGEFYDGNVSLKSELMSYSDDQLYEYIKLLSYCGFTGIQVTDMCSTWAAYGGYEYVHDRLRFMADAAHSMDMKFTLWVWAAEFNGYGWEDDTVSYYDYDRSIYAYEIPESVDTFDKYYSIYAELADCSDRVIAHFNDPGKLVTSEDIGFFSAMLREKMRASNPKISFGVSCYTDQIDKPSLVEYLGTDVVVYECASKTEADDLTGFRTQCNILGLDVGIWSWNLAEMEIDQLAEMNVNAEILKRVYNQTKQFDYILKPDYWSEMDSYHVLNMFSLYCSGHLLQNTEEDTGYLLRTVATDVFGKEYGEDMYRILELIQDARSGDRWETFRWEYPDFLMGAENYDAAGILDRCDRYIPVLGQIIEEKKDVSVAPLPIRSYEIAELILPHVLQIRQFAQFRIGMDEVYEMYDAGADRDVVEAKLEEIYSPIPEYNCIIGMWGQLEARTQYFILEDFCKRADLETPRDPVFTHYRKQRIYQEICTLQKNTGECYLMNKETGFQTGAAFGTEETARLIDELVTEGLLVENEDGEVFLVNWKDYVFKGVENGF